MKSFLIFTVLFIVVGCSTPDRKSEFAAIEIGMVKSEVLDAAGPPHWSDRQSIGDHSYDRWFYYMEPEARQAERVVYFLKGKVFQKGERIKPALSAEEMEEIKKPRVKKPKAFTPSMSEEELRQAIKKEIKKQEKKNPKKKTSLQESF